MTNFRQFKVRADSLSLPCIVIFQKKKEAPSHDLRIECQTNFKFLGFCGLELEPFKFCFVLGFVGLFLFCFGLVSLHILCFQKNNKSSGNSIGFAIFVFNIKHKCKSIGQRTLSCCQNDMLFFHNFFCLCLC